MTVTEVRVRLAGSRVEKLQAFCSVTFDDCFVVRDIRIIRGSHGSFVAMPSRKLADPCPQCGVRNHLRARYCNECGLRLPPDRAPVNPAGRALLYADIAHPIHAPYRAELERLILQAYADELVRAQQPGYQPPSDEFPDGLDAHPEELAAPRIPPPRPRADTPHSFGEGILP